MWGNIGAAVMQGKAISEGRMKTRKAIVAHMRETLSPEEFKEWEIKETEERRHRELCQAIRDSKPDINYSSGPSSDGMAYGVLGLALGLSLGD